MGREFFLALVRAYNAHRKATRQAIQAENLSDGYPKVLMNLLNNPGCLQKELAESCHVEPATMTVLLRGMQTKGLIRKEETHVSGGKRALRIYLTEEGEAMADRTTKIFADTHEKAVEGLTEEELKTLCALLDRVAENLTNA